MESRYVGNELHVFAHARQWKEYWSAQIRPLIVGDVLEVGAGIGANTATLYTPQVLSWHCLEPDPDLAREARDATAHLPKCLVSEATTTSLHGRLYDTVLYIDVLEHIEGDRQELARAAGLLRSGGHAIVLSPAHQFLYSPFDKAIGHYRRYDRKTLANCTPDRCSLERLAYLDAVGVCLSLAYRALLRSPQPSLRQILFWDQRVIPVSRFLDRLTGYRIGKSILGVWRKSC